jgi:hypothetical protein
MKLILRNTLAEITDILCRRLEETRRRNAKDERQMFSLLLLIKVRDASQRPKQLVSDTWFD